MKRNTLDWTLNVDGYWIWEQVPLMPLKIKRDVNVINAFLFPTSFLSFPGSLWWKVPELVATFDLNLFQNKRNIWRYSSMLLMTDCSEIVAWWEPKVMTSPMSMTIRTPFPFCLDPFLFVFANILNKYSFINYLNTTLLSQVFDTKPPQQIGSLCPPKPSHTLGLFIFIN